MGEYAKDLKAQPCVIKDTQWDCANSKRQFTVKGGKKDIVEKAYTTA
jgi:hypothetical protein